MKIFLVILGLTICCRVFAAPTSQLYTGDAVTVPPGQFRLQAYYDSSFGGPQRASGGSLTYGLTKSSDVKLGYGYLWNNLGPDLRLGPNLGIKRRFIGDGKKKTSVAISALAAFNNGVPGTADKNDYGALMIVQYPTKPFILLGNYGHVFVGNKKAGDLEYFAFAAARFANPRTLLAVEYSDLERLGKNRRRVSNQFLGAIVYSPNPRLGYSAQLGYIPEGRAIKWHLAIGVSKYL